jgi:hypothetical protein
MWHPGHSDRVDPAPHSRQAGGIKRLKSERMFNYGVVQI